MIILSHRGYWKENSEKNTKVAFERSFSLGFGVETDIRDFDGRLVISHDMPDRHCMSVEEFFRIYNQYSRDLPLALNIKADGLQKELKKLIEAFSIENYFAFDMSVPDALAYVRQGFRVFSRQSEYEGKPSLYEYADGVWLDEFNGHWIDSEIISEHMVHDKRVCIVSPELHGRDHWHEWKCYRECSSFMATDSAMLCTDFPEEAREYFSEKN